MKFKSIAASAESKISVRGSKFLGFAYPVQDAEAVAMHLEALRKRYFDATHHCYAWQLGYGETLRFRYSDDGEPSGTAGKPIYQILQQREVTNILVVSVRYFGGTKLGTGGLIRAYGRSASETLDAAKVREYEKGLRIAFHCSYELHPLLLRAINAFHIISLDQDFAEQVRLCVEVDESDAMRLIGDVRDASKGAVQGEILPEEPQ
ncbi:MAG: YigZ family protein [Candidatus Neomarinimicrobiota bacterium]|jgi:uncharacterized YigZ family protein|nr:IMPACT family protein [Candidatus Neomarinimicrobiota bacterium]